MSETLNNVTLVFEYTIAEGDEDTNGISVAANSLKLNSGTITDATNVSKNALLTPRCPRHTIRP